jgi:hypothetical protein
MLLQPEGFQCEEFFREGLVGFSYEKTASAVSV